jgi:hypothetical protein
MSIICRRCYMPQWLNVLPTVPGASSGSCFGGCGFVYFFLWTHTGDQVLCGGTVDRPCPRLEDSKVIASLMSKIPHAGFVV